ncbi:MAG: excinuclease ABC subunit UvrA, partial [Acidobacteria bacterium]|nr:excinuclease ABC subunit UvrA [Acidobacteriota bacterium]
MKIRFPYRAGSGKTQGNYEDTWDGVIENVERRYQETKSDAVRAQLHDYMSTLTCTACGGSRLRAESLAVTIGGRSLGGIVDLVGQVGAELSGVPAHGSKAGTGRQHA